MKKIILILVLFVIPNSLVLAFTPLQPIKTYTNSSLGSIYNPVYFKTLDTSYSSIKPITNYSFISNPYAPLGSQNNPIYIKSSLLDNNYIYKYNNSSYIKPLTNYSFISNPYAPLGSQNNPIYIK